MLLGLIYAITIMAFFILGLIGAGYLISSLFSLAFWIGMLIAFALAALASTLLLIIGIKYDCADANDYIDPKDF